MTWRFRKSFSPLPGVRITLSPSGVSTSVGVGPFRTTIGPRGPAFTARIPGTGVSFHQQLGGSSQKRRSDLPTPMMSPSGYIIPELSAPEMSDIKSTGSGALTTPGLDDFKRLLETAHREHGEIVRELSQVRSEESLTVERYTSWKNGWLKRRLFKAKFEQLQV